MVAASMAAVLLVASAFLPLWRMELIAPQYPKGLVLYAYGYKFADSQPSDDYDEIREINTLNHYIGMKPLKEVTEMKLFIPGLAALVAATVAASVISWQRKWLRLLVIAGYWTFPLFFIADLQYWLYDYGHTMNPDAPLDLEPFTPKVLGETRVWNFHTDNTFSSGFYLLVAAALLITLLPPLIKWVQAGEPGGRQKTSVGRGRSMRPASGQRGGVALKAVTLAALLSSAAIIVTPFPAHSESAGPSLQQLIDRAAPRDTITIDGGEYHERILIDKPLTLVGRASPVIDGGDHGDVVTITASDVYLAGFTVRGAGHAVTREPAAIKVKSAQGVTLRSNRIEDSHFGIYLLDSHETLIERNQIDLGKKTPIERRGHGIYSWQSHHSAIRENAITNSADAIHLEFSATNVIADNSATSSRYALHFMYANENKILRNSFRNNHAGAVLMFSRDLIVKDNELSANRRGATGTGLLLKDVDNIFVEGNRFERNKFGMTAEGTPQSAGGSAVFYGNLFALNDTGLGLMSNAPITFVGNSMIENSVQVKALGGAIASRLLTAHGAEAPQGQAPQASGHDHGAATSPAGGQAPAPGQNAGADGTLPKGAVWSANGRGNYWSDYRGYDSKGDGVGDKAYLQQPAFAGELANNDSLRFFDFTVAQQAIDAATQMFPLYRYDAVIEDPNPLMEPPVAFRDSFGAGLNTGVLALSVAFLALAAAGAFAVWPRPLSTSPVGVSAAPSAGGSHD